MSLPPLPAWQSAANDAHFSDPAACALRASKFERTIRIRNLVEYAAGGLAMVLFGASAIGAISKGETLIGMAMMLTMIGVAVVLGGIARRASNLDRRLEEPCLDHLARQYRRQFEALTRVPLWYIGPLVPGIIALFAAVAAGVAEVAGWQAALAGITQPALIVGGVFAAIIALNLMAARRLRRDLERIERLA